VQLWEACHTSNHPSHNHRPLTTIRLNRQRGCGVLRSSRGVSPVLGQSAFPSTGWNQQLTTSSEAELHLHAQASQRTEKSSHACCCCCISITVDYQVSIAYQNSVTRPTMQKDVMDQSSKIPSQLKSITTYEQNSISTNCRQSLSHQLLAQEKPS